MSRHSPIAALSGKTIRRACALALLALALVTLAQAARLAFRPDPRDDLRRADQLFAAGRYYEARGAYAAVVARYSRFAPALARLGVVYAVRDERAAADETLAAAVGMGLAPRDYAVVRLYQGHVAGAMGRRDLAAQLWRMVDEQSPLFAVRRALEAENLLAVADYSGAEAAYRVALLPGLPAEWRALAHRRLALLRASSDPAAALGELAQLDAAPAAATSAEVDWTAPLLPADDLDPRQLAGALRSSPDQRAPLLGQIYLRAQLYALAETQFAAVAPNSPAALSAAAYAAYARWSAGDRAEGLRRLQDLVAAHPDEARARALLALAYLSTRDAASAQAQLDVVRSLAPRAPDTHLAWGQWYAAQHDYVAAAAEYRRAFRDAPLDQLGVYALAAARFHVDTSFLVCESGRPAAEDAVRLLPDDPRALTALAAARFGCGDAAGAREAAERALQRSPSSAEASYYLGRALAALGERSAARQALVNAADLAPASDWRTRAEAQIAALGL